MTEAFGSPDRHWILRYIGLQRKADKRVTAALQHALDDAGAALSKLEGKDGVGAATRRAQLLGAQGSLSKVLKELFKEVGDITREEQANAAGLAAQLMYEDEKAIWSIIERDAKKRKVLEEGLERTARRNVQSMMTRILKTEMPLSKRIYRAEANAKGQLSRLINSHLARGSSAEDLARDTKRFFRPDTPGGVTYAARRLARTEINNAFHAQSIADSAERPWVNQVRWNLSKSHPPRQPECTCDRYAHVGIFPADDIPRKPHPNCLCSITPVVPDFETAYNAFMSGQYSNYLDRLPIAA